MLRLRGRECRKQSGVRGYRFFWRACADEQFLTPALLPRPGYVYCADKNDGMGGGNRTGRFRAATPRKLPLQSQRALAATRFHPCRSGLRVRMPNLPFIRYDLTTKCSNRENAPRVGDPKACFVRKPSSVKPKDLVTKSAPFRKSWGASTL